MWPPNIGHCTNKIVDKGCMTLDGWWVWLGWVREGSTPPAPARGYGGAL